MFLKIEPTLLPSTFSEKKAIRSSTVLGLCPLTNRETRCYLCPLTDREKQWITMTFSLTKEVTQWYPSIWPDFVLIRVTIDMTKHLDQKQLGRKSLFFYTLISLLIRSKGRIGIERAGTWWQELIQKSWRSTYCWLAPHSLFGPLYYNTQDYQARVCTTHNGLSPSISTTI